MGNMFLNLDLLLFKSNFEVTFKLAWVNFHVFRFVD